MYRKDQIGPPRFHFVACRTVDVTYRIVYIYFCFLPDGPVSACPVLCTANPGLELANAVAAAMAEAEAAAAAAAAGTAAPAVAPPGVVAVPPGLLVAPAGMQVAPPMWAMPGAAAAAGQAAAAAAAAQPAPLAVHPPPQPDAGMGAGVGALDPQAAIQAQLAATAAAAAAAEPADLWALLRPPPPPPGMPAASMSRTGSTTAVGLAGMGGQEAVAPATEVVAGVAGAQEAPAGTGAAATRRTPLRVVAIYKGQGRVAGAGACNCYLEGVVPGCASGCSALRATHLLHRSSIACRTVCVSPISCFQHCCTCRMPMTSVRGPRRLLQPGLDRRAAVGVRQWAHWVFVAGGF